MPSGRKPNSRPEIIGNKLIKTYMCICLYVHLYIYIYIYPYMTPARDPKHNFQGTLVEKPRGLQAEINCRRHSGSCVRSQKTPRSSGALRNSKELPGTPKEHRRTQETPRSSQEQLLGASWVFPVCSWLLLAAPCCSWLLLAAAYCSFAPSCS